MVASSDTRPRRGYSRERILILGGGFGGIATALGLRERLAPADEIVLVDRRETFVMGLRKNWGITGMEPIAAGERRLDSLRDRGIDVRRGEVTAIDAVSRSAEIDGLPVDADALAYEFLRRRCNGGCWNPRHDRGLT